MTAWGTDSSFYDDVERDHLDWLKENLPNYLALHETYCGFLPENFNGGLSDADVRAGELRRLGFLNYSILINALLVQRAAKTAPSLTSMLDVYGRTSAFFLRAGAVIDIALPLEETQNRLYQGGKIVETKDAPARAVLKKSLGTVDQYNNFLKHNGLPAVRLVSEAGGQTVQIPEEIPMRGAIWAAQNPNAKLGTLLECYALEIMSALNVFYGALNSAGAKALGGWSLAQTSTPAGIRTVLKQASSGSIAPLDGYQSHQSSSFFSKLKWE